MKHRPILASILKHFDSNSDLLFNQTQLVLCQAAGGGQQHAVSQPAGQPAGQQAGHAGTTALGSVQRDDSKYRLCSDSLKMQPIVGVVQILQICKQMSSLMVANIFRP